MLRRTTGDSPRTGSEGFVQGVRAAAVGAIAGAAVILSKRALVDLATVLIATTFAVLALVKKIPEPVLILIAGAVGIVLRHGT